MNESSLTGWQSVSVPLGPVDNLDPGTGYSLVMKYISGTDDVCYVVTFQMVDPFWTIDLSDPTNPTVLGELVIPGFSYYLHPVDDQHVIGVGVDVDIPWITDMVKVALFDVSDMTNPFPIPSWGIC